MSFALPESLRQYIDERVRSGGYGNTSEYLRDLIRQDQQAQAAQRFRALIAEGLQSGAPRPATEEVIDELRRTRVRSRFVTTAKLRPLAEADLVARTRGTTDAKPAKPSASSSSTQRSSPCARSSVPPMPGRHASVSCAISPGCARCGSPASPVAGSISSASTRSTSSASWRTRRTSRRSSPSLILGSSSSSRVRARSSRTDSPAVTSSNAASASRAVLLPLPVTSAVDASIVRLLLLRTAVPLRRRASPGRRRCR